MSGPRSGESVPAFGIDALMDVDGQGGSAHGWQGPAGADGVQRGRPLRRDLHWWVGGGLLLLALPMLAWQAIGTDGNDDRTSRRGASSSAAGGGAQVRPPESTGALDRTIEDQSRVASVPAFPPLPPMPLDPGRPLSQRMPVTGAPASTAPVEAGRPAGALLAPAPVDPLQARKDALAAEQERRIAEARASPVLAIGGAGGGATGATGGGAALSGAVGPSAAAMAALLRDGGSMPGERNAAPGFPAIPVHALGYGGGASGGGASGGGASGVGASGGGASGDARSDGAWLEQARTRRPSETAPATSLRPAPAGPVLLEGTVIPAVLLTGINSDLPGTLVAQVTQDIWDSVHGKHLLVPKGSRLVGDYNSDVRPGQERVLAAFRRLILPDGSSIDLMGTQATDAQGRSGLHDRVDRHFWTLFGSSFIVAALASLVQRREAQPSTVIVVPGGGSSTASSVSSAAGTVLVDTSRAILGRSRNVSPTLHIGQGHRFSLTVQRSFLLTPEEAVTMSELPR